MPISIIAQMALLERLRNWPDDVVWCWVALDALELCAPVSRETLNFPSLPENNNYLESINTTRPSKDPFHTQLFCHCPPRVIDLFGPSLTKSLTIFIYIYIMYICSSSLNSTWACNYWLELQTKVDFICHTFAIWAKWVWEWGKWAFSFCKPHVRVFRVVIGGESLMLVMMLIIINIDISVNKQMSTRGNVIQE